MRKDGYCLGFSKRQLPTLILFKTTLIQTIILYELQTIYKAKNVCTGFCAKTSWKTALLRIQKVYFFFAKANLIKCFRGGPKLYFSISHEFFSALWPPFVNGGWQVIESSVN